ncbi:hypothetical protein HMPREF0027_0161, partial [Actinobacillus ureae ATCC 25976]
MLICSLLRRYFRFICCPTFAKLHEKSALQKELIKALKFVGISVIWTSLTIFTFKHWIILLLYTEDFLAMEPLFIWQLLGDVFKVMAYVFGYLIVAKASLKLYAAAEFLA